MAVGLHNKENFKEYVWKKQIINGKPLDWRLLKEEIKDNYYFDALNSLADVKRHMCETFVQNFFGTTSYRFSKKELTVTCYNKDTIAVYEIIWEKDNLSLILDRHEQRAV